MIEKDIDCRKHRKSTHLASADVDSMQLDGNPLIFKIEEAYYDSEAFVNGKTLDGYFIKLEGVKKHWKVNSTNRTIISGFAKNKGLKSAEAYNIGNWKGLMIELFVDRNVKFSKKIVDGIRVKKLQPKTEEKKIFSEEQFKKAFENNATIEDIEKHYTVTEDIKLKYTAYGTKK